MVVVKHIIVKVPQQKKKYRILHDHDLSPPVEDTQIIAALRQQFDLLSFTIENGVGTALVQKNKSPVALSPTGENSEK